MDYFDILNIDKSDTPKQRTPTQRPTPAKNKDAHMSRELANLARNNPQFTERHILAMSQRHPLTNKEKRRLVSKEEPVQRWVWVPFRNSARKDRARFYHWEKADENGLADTRKDYKFARLNKKIVCFVYTDAEYEEYLNFLCSDWTKEETDELFSLCQQFDLRWPIIADRFSSDKSIEQLKDRYYSVAKALIEVRATTDELKESAKTHPIMTNSYDYDHEVKRKQQLEYAFTRSQGEEAKEMHIREQLKKIEAVKKRRLEETRKEQQKLKKKKKKKAAEKKNVPAFGVAQVATIRPKKSATPHVAKILSQMDGGVYSRRTLMLYREDDSVERRVDVGLQEYDIANPLATPKVHEAYEIFRNRLSHKLELEKRLGRKEAERAMLGGGSGRGSGATETMKRKKRKDTDVSDAATLGHGHDNSVEQPQQKKRKHSSPS